VARSVSSIFEWDTCLPLDSPGFLSGFPLMVPYGQQIDGFNYITGLGEALQELCIVGLDPGLDHAHKHMRVCPDLA